MYLFFSLFYIHHKVFSYNAIMILFETEFPSQKFFCLRNKYPGNSNFELKTL